MEDTLPPLRQELRLEAGATRPDGSVAWMLHDPVQHSHFELDPLDIALLARWTTGGCERLLAQCRADPALPPTEVLRPHLHGLLAFLTEHRLLRAEGAEAARALATRQLASRLTPWQWLLRHHLSLRLPLGDAVIDPLNGSSLSRQELEDRLEPYLRRGRDWGSAAGAGPPAARRQSRISRCGWKFRQCRLRESWPAASLT